MQKAWPAQVHILPATCNRTNDAMPECTIGHGCAPPDATLGHSQVGIPGDLCPVSLTQGHTLSCGHSHLSVCWLL